MKKQEILLQDYMIRSDYLLDLSKTLINLINNEKFNDFALASIIISACSLESFLNEIVFYLQEHLKSISNKRNNKLYKLYLENLILIERSRNNSIGYRVEEFSKIFLKRENGVILTEIENFISVRNAITHSKYGLLNMTTDLTPDEMKSVSADDFMANRMKITPQDANNLISFLRKKKFYPENESHFDLFEVIGRKKVAIWASELVREYINFVMDNIIFSDFRKEFKKIYYLTVDTPFPKPSIIARIAREIKKEKGWN